MSHLAPDDITGVGGAYPIDIKQACIHGRRLSLRGSGSEQRVDVKSSQFVRLPTARGLLLEMSRWRFQNEDSTRLCETAGCHRHARDCH